MLGPCMLWHELQPPSLTAPCTMAAPASSGPIALTSRPSAAFTGSSWHDRQIAGCSSRSIACRSEACGSWQVAHCSPLSTASCDTGPAT